MTGCQAAMFEQFSHRRGVSFFQSIPPFSTRIAGKPCYLFESSVLRAFGARLMDLVTAHTNKSIPKFAPTEHFPYRELHGRACFVCEGDDDNPALFSSDPHVCAHCNPSVPLDTAHPQKVIAHIGSHILHDPGIDRSTEPCGLCGRPAPMCTIFLKKSSSGSGALTVDMKASRGCPNLIKRFSIGAAAKSIPTSPCSNAPMKCPACSKRDPAVWRYNIKEHLIRHHPDISLQKHAHLWELTSSEKAGMKVIWTKRKEQKAARKHKHTLIISEAHSSRRALASENLADPDDVESESSETEASEAPSPILAPEDLEKIADLPDPEMDEDFPLSLGSHQPTPIELEAGSAREGLQVYVMGPSDGVSKDVEMSPENLASIPPNPTAASVTTISAAIPNTQISQTAATPAAPVRSGRKRTVRPIDLELCICGESAGPLDPESVSDGAQCANDGCETKWYHLECLGLESVEDDWICEPCLSSDEPRVKRRRR